MNEGGETVAVNDLGAGTVRFTLYWNETEPGFDSYNFGPLDTHLDLTVGYGKRIYISIGESAPAWAASCPQCAPYDYNYYGNLVEAVIRETYARYPSADVVFGIWNEPNLDSFLRDTSDAQVYGSLFQYASAARDRVNPSIRLGGPETNHAAIFSNNYFDWAISRMGPYLHSGDVVTAHWYPDGGNLAGYMGHVNLEAAGREVWLTESGKATCDDAAQQSQDQFIIDTFNNSTINWSRAFLYRLRSGSNCDESIVRADWSYRPTFSWYQGTIAKIANSVVMGPNQSLFQDQQIVSADGRFTLYYGNDGNLVLYRWDGFAIWASNTSGKSTGQVVMQGDGNLVIYDGSGFAVWDSHTNENFGAYLAVQNNGNLVVYRPSNSIAWASRTGIY